MRTERQIVSLQNSDIDVPFDLNAGSVSIWKSQSHGSEYRPLEPREEDSDGEYAGGGVAMSASGACAPPPPQLADRMGQLPAAKG